MAGGVGVGYVDKGKVDKWKERSSAWGEGIKRRMLEPHV